MPRNTHSPRAAIHFCAVCRGAGQFRCATYPTIAALSTMGLDGEADRPYNVTRKEAAAAPGGNRG